MQEFNFENLTEPPEHLLRAEQFIDVVKAQIIPRFRSLTIVAVNQTEEDLRQFPQLIEEVRSKGDEETVKLLNAMDLATERDSAFSTQVFISISGNGKRRLTEVVKEISQKAKMFKATKTTDSAVGPARLRNAMAKVFGQESGLANLALHQRYLGYTFSDTQK